MAFSIRAGTNWCHDFPKLARESGFYFNMRGARVRVDWNRISAIDIDKVIRERDFLTIDENINNVIDYCLESEYDIKILDSSFVKLFRLAQLSVEYLLYCKQYLDHSVIILKDELRLKIEQSVNMKKEIAALEDTVKSLKERSREKCKLIEAKIGDSSGEIYKCPHCPKTFVSAMFVNAHVARRHSYISDMRVSTSPIHEHYRAETEKLHNEIKTLKERLNQTERIIRNESDKLLGNTEKDYIRGMSKDEYDNRTERAQEHRRFQEDIGSLKSILFDEIRALKEKEHTVNENILETSIKVLISQQEKEIESLRNQLLGKLTPGIENMNMKLQTQENYWKTKIENIESQHCKDIERLTTELKVTQQAANCIKSEYASKVHDLEKQSMDQSNMLVEQKRQLNCLSREISNSQTQDNNYHREKSIIEKLRNSPILKKHDNINCHNDNDIYHKSLSAIGNDEMVIEDIGSESSQEYGDKLVSISAQNKCVLNKLGTLQDKNNRKLNSDLSKTTKYMATEPDQKSSGCSENVRKMRDKTNYYDVLKDVNEINIKNTDRYKTFAIKSLENVPINVSTKTIESIERKKTFNVDDIRNSKKSELLEKHSVSSMTESESTSLLSQSESDSESTTVGNDVTVNKYDMSVVTSPNIKKISIQENVQTMFYSRLRDLGIDPEWQGIPTATFKQKMEIIKHQQNINSKKLIRYSQIKQQILKDVLKKISVNHNELEYTKKPSSNKLVTHAKSKALKAFGNHKDSDEYIPVQKMENTTPSKLRMKQKIELLPKKYKEDLPFDDTCVSPTIRNWVDMYVNNSKAVAAQTRLISNRYNDINREASSISSIESQEDVKQNLSTKVTVSDTVTCKTESPVSRKHVIASRLSEKDSDSTILQQDSSIASPKNNKSVLKSASGSVGSLIKKKVLFDLEDGKGDIGALSDDGGNNQLNDSDWNISSFPEESENASQDKKFPSTGNIILKTAQSDKIAEISKKIQEQLSIVRKPPVGSVETIFRSNMDLQDTPNYDAGNLLLNSNSIARSISESPVRNFTNPKAKNSVFPQPAPRNLKDKNDSIAHCEDDLSSSKHSDLDSDIDEILRIE